MYLVLIQQSVYLASFFLKFYFKETPYKHGKRLEGLVEGYAQPNLKAGKGLDSSLGIL